MSRVQRRCMYLEVAKDMDQLTLTITHREEPWKDMMAELGDDAKIPFFVAHVGDVGVLSRGSPAAGESGTKRENALGRGECVSWTRNREKLTKKRGRSGVASEKR